MSPQARRGAPPIDVVHIIARLNIGGPAIQTITLIDRLNEHRYRCTLVRGVEEPDEGNMDHLAEELGVRPTLVPWLRRNPGWWDVPALLSLVRILRRHRPAIVHTHAAKGGALGRAAALIAFPRRARRPVLIHTYHGTSLTGYFSARKRAVYRTIERLLAKRTDRLIAVSPEVRDQLIGIGVAPPRQFEVVPLGFDLSQFAVNGSERQRTRNRLREELGVAQDARLVTLIARLVPIKRVDRFLRVAAALRDLPGVRFLIVGDGELREQLKGSPEAMALNGRLVWAGFRRDMPAVCFASDVVVQTSDNEGTPVALIEAQAAGVPVVSTRVGGTASVVGPSGALFAPEDDAGLASGIRSALESSGTIDQAAVPRQDAVSRFGLDRLMRDVDRVYRDLLDDQTRLSNSASRGAQAV